MKSRSQKDICSPKFTAALFAVAKIWKQSKCPTVGGENVIYLYRNQSIYLSIIYLSLYIEVCIYLPYKEKISTIFHKKKGL